MAPIPAYSPHWLWRTYRFFERLPIPYWLIALVVIVVLAAVKHLTAWDLGLLPRGRLNAYLAASGIYLVVVPYLWQMLNRHAVNAYAELTGKVGEERLSVSLPQFLSLPPVPALLIAVAGAATGYSEFQRSAARLEPLSAEVLPVMGAIEWSVTYVVLALVVLRVIVQIGHIRRLLDGLELDVFNPGPVYSLSRYGAAFTATILFTFHGLILLSMPRYYLSPSGLVFILLFSIGAIISFLAPLAAINTRLSRAKETLLCRIGDDQRRINERLHAAIGTDALDDLGDLRVAVGVLKEQREMVEKLSTWPWLGQSVRGVAPALLLPVLVYIAQRVVGLILGI